MAKIYLVCSLCYEGCSISSHLVNPKLMKSILQNASFILFPLYTYAAHLIFALYMCTYIYFSLENANTVICNYYQMHLIGFRDVKQLHLANVKLRIPEDTISMPNLARICSCSLCTLFCRVGDFISNWKISFFSSQNSD